MAKATMLTHAAILLLALGTLAVVSAKDCAAITCPAEGPGVCAKGGQTYTNRCNAECADAEIIHEGECGKVDCTATLCSLEIAPVCANGKTYRNKCLAICANEVDWTEGPCTLNCQVVRCGNQYKPVCADGKTYTNLCQALCVSGVKKIDYDGECFPKSPAPKPSCICTLQYAPVCGTDGVTYGNACSAGCAGATIDYQGECRKNTACTKIYKPVCGTDGKTYGNSCVAKAEGATIAYDGPCTKECNKCNAILEQPVCVISKSGQATSYSSPCFAACRGNPVNFYNYYDGKCNSKCDKKCAGRGFQPSARRAQCCTKQSGGPEQLPNYCYAECLPTVYTSCYKGGCKGKDAVAMVGNCSKGTAIALCLRNACSAPTDTCSKNPNSTCVASSCQNYYRGTLTGICSAVWVDNNTGAIVKGCGDH